MPTPPVDVQTLLQRVRGEIGGLALRVIEQELQIEHLTAALDEAAAKLLAGAATTAEDPA